MTAPGGWPVIGRARLSIGRDVDVVLETVTLDGPAGLRVEIERPGDPGALLQEWCERADPDAPIPYWAEIWPASRAIAQCLRTVEDLARLTVLDLGCGLGLAGITAALHGASVTFLDHNPDAIAFARRNAERAGVRESVVRFHTATWRDESWVRSFDLVLGADVVYDRSDHAPVAALLVRLLEKGGRAWIGDPRRAPTESFLEDWRGEQGRDVRTFPCGAEPGVDVDVEIHELTVRPVEGRGDQGQGEPPKLPPCMSRSAVP